LTSSEHIGRLLAAASMLGAVYGGFAPSPAPIRLGLVGIDLFRRTTAIKPARALVFTQAADGSD